MHKRDRKSASPSRKAASPRSAKEAQEVSSSTWMHWFVGASEANLIHAKEQFVDDRGNLKHQKTGQLWPMGAFEQPAVALLRRHVKGLPRVRRVGQRCSFEVIDSTDIGNFQATLTTQDKAMVQIASNFNCLENASPHMSADEGGLVSGYAEDCTQGPAAAFGVPAASLLRAHYAFKEEGTPPERWGQASDRQVNLLEDICGVGKYCGKCQNGKALLLGSEKPVTPDLLNEVSGMVKIGLHTDAQVVFRRSSRSKDQLEVIDSPQFVDQVCSATLCYGYADCVHEPPPEDFENLTRALLRAAYEGAYLAAIARERRVLLLTLIGGASFGNPHNLILEELKRAHEKFSMHKASQLEKVCLVMYDRKVAREYQKAIEQTIVPPV